MVDQLRLNPRKSPRQGRSQATCGAILEAAAHILVAEGRHALTTNRIAERAGVSIGSLYQYFPGKEAILAALIRDMRREMLEDFAAAARESAGRDLARAAEALIAAVLRHHMRHPTLAQALEREEAELSLDAETRELKGKMRRILVDILSRHGVAEPERTAFDLSALSRGMTDAAVQAGERDFDDLFRRVRRAVFGYLHLPEEGRPRVRAL